MTDESNYLAAIFERKRRRVSEEIARVSLDEIKEPARARRMHTEEHAFKSAISREVRVNVIAEFKRASPSKGEIRSDRTAAEVAKSYEQGGAAAVSVLTEEDHFSGSLRDLEEVKQAVSLPTLRKDFIFDEYQIYQAAAAGADAVLLIAAMLPDDSLAGLRRLTEEELRMDALVEVHTAEEMLRAEWAGASLIGVNNRDLKSFRVSLETSYELASRAPRGATLISESGIRSGDDLRKLRAAGYAAFLIGETLMRADNPAQALRSLLDEAEASKSF